jgi:hypothetical protein
MNVTDLLTREYDKMDTWSIGKNEPKTNPNEPKTNPKRTQTNPKRTQNEPKTNPIQTQNKPNSKPILVRHLCGGAEPKMNVSSVFTRNYEQFTMNNELKNKPNQNQPVVSLPALSAAEGSNLFQDLIYPQKPVKNYLSIALFPLTSGPARDYNGIFSILYISGEIQMKGVGNE